MVSLRIALIVVVLAVPLGAVAATSLPAQGPAWCDDHDVIVNSTWIGQFGDGIFESSPELITWQKATNAVKVDAQYVSSCRPDATRDLFAAYLALEQGVLAFHSGNNEWRDHLNLARQLFVKCISRRFGKPEGASCETMAQKVSHYLIHFSSSM